MPVISPCPITASRHSKQCLEYTHLHLLNPCFSPSFFCIYCYSPMPAPKILFTILFLFFWSMRAQWVVIFLIFFHMETTISIKQTNQPNPDGLLTLNCFNSNVIPDRKIVKNGHVWFGEYVHFWIWTLECGSPLWVGSSAPALCSCSRKPDLTGTSISLHHSRIWGICSSSELYLEIWSWSNMDWSHT